MRAAVFGAGGMLGVALIRELERRGVEVSPWPHSIVDIADPAAVGRAFGTHWHKPDPTVPKPDVVFNAAGVLNTSHDYPAMIRTNALGPHVIAKAARVFGAKVIHVSTDCVFSGATERWAILPRRGYSTIHVPDPRDLYGRSKLLGEVQAPHVTNVRTSFVGPDHGLWAWVVEQARAGAKIEGWTRAWWSGSTVWAVARGLVDLAVPADGDQRAFESPSGIVHLATEKPITKHDAVIAIAAVEGLELEIVPTDHIYVDRALHPTHVLPSLEEALDGMLL